MAKGMTLVGLDVHARQTHAAVLNPDTAELGVSRLRMAPVGVASFLDGLGPGVRAVYEAGPTGFGLARAGRERGIDVRVAAPGSIPKGPATGSRPTAATRSAWPACWPPASCRSRSCQSVADESFRDLVRCIEDIRGDLMRARHRLGKFLLRRGER
jgi:transposase